MVAQTNVEISRETFAQQVTNAIQQRRQRLLELSSASATC